MHAPAAPTTEQDIRYGEPDAPPTPWADAESAMAAAELWWCTTLRPQGGPHITPLLSVWHDGAPHICTGVGEQKWHNLAADARCTMLTGRNDQGPGTDHVVEGVAERVTDEGLLRELAAAWEAKYGDAWHFDVADGAFVSDGRAAHVFRVRPTVAYAFGKSPFSQTRYRWPGGAGGRGGLGDASLRSATAAVRLPAQDLGRARRFYAEQLGLEPAEARDGGLRYVCGGSELVVFASAGRPSGTHTQVGFTVADIDATVAELTARGVRFERVELDGRQADGVVVDVPGHYPSTGALGERAAWFRDSEGNLLGIGQPVLRGTPEAARDAFAG